MKFIFLFFISIILPSYYYCQTDGEDYKDDNNNEAKKIPQIDFIGLGYNALYGNPQSLSGLDPGYTNFRMTQILYSKKRNQNQFNKEYIFPVGVNVNMHTSCSEKINSQEGYSLQLYKDQLSVSSGVSSDFSKLSFSASAEYQTMQEELEKHEFKIVEKSARCSHYKLTLSRNAKMIQITSQFKELMKQLEDDEMKFFDVFDQIGTHVIQEVELGFLYGYSFWFDKKAHKKLEESGINLGVQLDIAQNKKTNNDDSNIDKNKGVKSNVSNKNKALEEVMNSISAWQSFSSGAFINESDDIIQWMKQPKENPMPIRLKLSSLLEFIQQYDMDNSFIQFKNQTQFFKNLKSHLNQYFQIPVRLRQNRLKLKKIFKNSTNKGEQDVLIIESETGYVFTQFEGQEVLLEKRIGFLGERWYLIHHETKETYRIQNMYSKQCMLYSKDELKMAECDPGNENMYFTIDILDWKEYIVNIKHKEANFYHNKDNKKNQKHQRLRITIPGQQLLFTNDGKQ